MSRLLVPIWVTEHGVTHAGDTHPNSGHHHLLVDINERLDPNEPIPTDKNRLAVGQVHFGLALGDF